MPRGRALVVVLVVAALVVYGTVVALYAFNERAVTVVGCTDDAPDGAVLLSLTPTGVDAAADRMAATLTVVSWGPADGDAPGIPADDLTLILTGTDGPSTYAYEGGAIPSPISFRFITDGAIERWPFDSHTSQFSAVMVEETAGSIRAVPTILCGSAHVPGWSFASTQVASTGTLVLDGGPVDEVRLEATRSAATVAFGLVILALMIVLPVLGLSVAIRVLRGERKAEASLMSWMAAMLFATIPMRTFLPGSPPIGSWVDYLVVLWVVVGLVASLVIYAIAWLRWAPAGERPR